MARRVYLHVGTPKTGTSYVQDMLFLNPEALADQGFLYPADRHDAQFLAALDLMQLTWGGLERQAVGCWARLAAQARAHDGDVIVSHEIFGTASRAHVEKALADLGDAEVHLVVSVRDLVRQIPAEWQENVKHRRVLRYREFLRQIMDPERSSEIGGWFWGVQEVPAVLSRWGSTLPPERVHVVTVPRPGAPKDLLWQRFCGVFGLDPTPLTQRTQRANASLGVPETAFLRRLNERVNKLLPNELYRDYVREMVVHRTLSVGQSSDRLTLPPDVYDWAAALQREWVETLRAASYDVVGDLDELIPEPPQKFSDPDAPDEALVAASGIKAIAPLVEEIVRLRDVESQLHAEIRLRDTEIDDYHHTLGFRARHKVVRTAEGSIPIRAALSAYRHLRGR